MNFDYNRQSVSFLNARDPSILANSIFTRTVKENLRKNLYQNESDDSSFTSVENSEENPSICEDDNHIQVYLRIKNEIPSHGLYDINDDTLVCKVPPGSNVMRNLRNGENMSKLYKFSKIFKPNTNQIDIFNDIIKRKIVDFINGINTTFFTYGASGSGKTFTIVGTEDEPGIIPQTLEYLFRSLPNITEIPTIKPLPNGTTTLLDYENYIKENKAKLNLIKTFINKHEREIHVKTYSDMQKRLSNQSRAIVETYDDVSLNIWVSFAEIYNENIYDLLVAGPTLKNRPRPKLSLGNVNNFTYIKDLTNIHVTSGLEAYQVLQCGIHNLNYAATSVNSHSSRSHSIFTIKLIQTGPGGSYISYFNLCDLAGSERLKKTGNIGDRLKESNNINRSLSVLCRCINDIKEAKYSRNDGKYKMVPFRESKLTRLFQNALIGLENIAMIITMNPALDMFDETHHVLNFSAVAKDVVIERKPVNNFNELLDSMSKVGENDYLKQISELQLALEMQKLEYEEKLDQQHDSLVSRCKNLIERKTNLLEKQYKLKIERITSDYENQLQEKHKKNDVVLIDDSDEENDTNIENDRLIDNKQETEHLKVEIEQLKEEIELKDKLIRDLQEQIRKQSSDYLTQKRKSIQLETQFKEMEENYVQELKEKIELQDKLLLMEYEPYSDETDCVGSLEDLHH